MTTTRNLGKWMTATPIEDEWVVRALNGDVLGGIVWFPRWRQFEFEPHTNTMFSWDCLKALSEFLVELNKQKRGAAQPSPQGGK